MNEDISEITARNLVIAVSRAVRLSMLHRLENDAIAATSQNLRDAVAESLGQTGGAAVKVGGDGVFVNGALVRALGEVAESAERLQKHFARLGVETLAFSQVPDDAGVRALLQAFQACTAGDARPLFALELPGLKARAPGQGGDGVADENTRVVGAFVDVVVAVDDLQAGRVRRTAPLRRGLQRLSDIAGAAPERLLGLIGASLLGDRRAPGAKNDVAAAAAALVLLTVLRGGRPQKEAVALAFLTALAGSHSSVDDVVAAGALLTDKGPAVAALRLELMVSARNRTPATGFAAVVAAAEIAVSGWANGGSIDAARAALAQSRGIAFDDDAAAVLALLSA
jgi:hypothetical protein